jgi:polysaccharide pyruvyl transferase WcaK-like protein
VTAAKQIAFWGNFGTRNLGNECTLGAALYNARARRPDAPFVCFCTAPVDAQFRHSLPCFPLNSARRPPGPTPPLLARIVRRLKGELAGWREALRHTRATELLVMTGTGMLTDDGEGPLGLPYDIFRWAVAARLTGCRLVFLSVGVEGLRHPLARFFIRTALWLATFRSYRDVQSQERLRRAGFFSKADAVYPDLAFSLPQAMVLLTRTASRGPPPRARVAIGLYAYKDRGAASAEDAALYRAYVEKVCSVALALRARGHALRLVIGDNTYDEPVLEDVRAALSAQGLGPGTEFEDSPASSFQEVLKQLAQVDLVLASRFHNVLLALLLGKPVVSLSYNEKNDALMEEMGLEAFSGRLDDFNVERVLAQLATLQNEAPRLLPAVARKAAHYRLELETQYDTVFGPRTAALDQNARPLMSQKP